MISQKGFFEPESNIQFATIYMRLRVRLNNSFFESFFPFFERRVFSKKEKLKKYYTISIVIRDTYMVEAFNKGLSISIYCWNLNDD